MIENRLDGHLPPITAYDAIQTLPKCDIAWEFLRRNIDYRRDVARFGSDAIIRDRDWHGIAVYRQARICEAAARWGLIGLCAPDMMAPVEHLFWLSDDTDTSPSVLTVPGNGRTSQALMHAQPRFLIDIDDRVSLHLRMGGTVVRLPVLNETPLQLGNDIAFTINHGQEWGSIERISRGFRQMQDPTVWTAQRLSLRDALIAFDRTHAGLRYRDIACLLLGDARVDQEWQIGRTALKDRIRRAVKRGEKLVGGGYRALLRPSASSRDMSSRNRVAESGDSSVYSLQGGVV